MRGLGAQGTGCRLRWDLGMEFSSVSSSSKLEGTETFKQMAAVTAPRSPTVTSELLTPIRALLMLLIANEGPAERDGSGGSSTCTGMLLTARATEAGAAKGGSQCRHGRVWQVH